MVVLIILIGAFYALPNLYGEDPALQVSGARGMDVDDSSMQTVKKALDDRKIDAQYELENGQLIVRFKTTEDQLVARDIAAKALGENYITALNLAPATPAWMRSLGMHPLKLGLDLRGGVHFLMEVDMDAAMKKMTDQLEPSFVTTVSDFQELVPRATAWLWRSVTRKPAMTPCRFLPPGTRISSFRIMTRMTVSSSARP